MRTIKLIGRDIKYGIIKRWYVLLLPVVFSLSQVWRCHELVANSGYLENEHTTGTVMDYILYSVQGMEVYVFSPRNYFIIPIYWFVFQMGVAYMAAYYTYDDLALNGRSIFLAVKDRKSWWSAKCCWCICQTMMYYLVAFVFIIVSAVAFGAELTCKTTRNFIETTFGINACSLSGQDLILTALILPFMITLAITMVQILFSMIINPVMSFAVVCAIYVVSAYYTRWYFLGNYTMWVRSSYVTDKGVYPVGGIVISIALFTVSLIAGYMYIDNKDVI